MRNFPFIMIVLSLICLSVHADDFFDAIVSGLDGGSDSATQESHHNKPQELIPIEASTRSIIVNQADSDTVGVGCNEGCYEDGTLPNLELIAIATPTPTATPVRRVRQRAPMVELRDIRRGDSIVIKEDLRCKRITNDSYNCTFQIRRNGNTNTLRPDPMAINMDTMYCGLTLKPGHSSLPAGTVLEVSFDTENEARDGIRAHQTDIYFMQDSPARNLLCVQNFHYDRTEPPFTVEQFNQTLGRFMEIRPQQ